MVDNDLHQGLILLTGKLQERIFEFAPDLVLPLGKVGDQAAKGRRHTEHMLDIVCFQWTLIGPQHRLLHGKIIELSKIILQPLEMLYQEIDLGNRKKRAKKFKEIP